MSSWRGASPRVVAAIIPPLGHTTTSPTRPTTTRPSRCSPRCIADCRVARSSVTRTKKRVFFPREKKRAEEEARRRHRSVGTVVVVRCRRPKKSERRRRFCCSPRRNARRCCQSVARKHFERADCFKFVRVLFLSKRGGSCLLPAASSADCVPFDSFSRRASSR